VYLHKLVAAAGWLYGPTHEGFPAQQQQHVIV